MSIREKRRNYGRPTPAIPCSFPLPGGENPFEDIRSLGACTWTPQAGTRISDSALHTNRIAHFQVASFATYISMISTCDRPLCNKRGTYLPTMCVSLYNTHRWQQTDLIHQQVLGRPSNVPDVTAYEVRFLGLIKRRSKRTKLSAARYLHGMLQSTIDPVGRQPCLSTIVRLPCWSSLSVNEGAIAPHTPALVPE